MRVSHSKAVSTALATIAIILVLILGMSWMAYMTVLNAAQQARHAGAAETAALKAKELVRVYIWLDPANQPGGGYRNLTRISFVNTWSGETTINSLLIVWRDGRYEERPVSIRLGAGEDKTYLPSQLGLEGLDNYQAALERIKYIQVHTSLGNDFVSLWGRPDKPALYVTGTTRTVTYTVTRTFTTTTTSSPPPPPPPPPPTTTTSSPPPPPPPPPPTTTTSSPPPPPPPPPPTTSTTTITVTQTVTSSLYSGVWTTSTSTVYTTRVTTDTYTEADIFYSYVFYSVTLWWLCGGSGPFDEAQANECTPQKAGDVFHNYTTAPLPWNTLAFIMLAALISSPQPKPRKPFSYIIISLLSLILATGLFHGAPAVKGYSPATTVITVTTTTTKTVTTTITTSGTVTVTITSIYWQTVTTTFFTYTSTVTSSVTIGRTCYCMDAGCGRVIGCQATCVVRQVG
ncbi:MAG: hypothetical protein QXH59_04040 [Candidatus Caldarchaeum sp.]